MNLIRRCLLVLGFLAWAAAAAAQGGGVFTGTLIDPNDKPVTGLVAIDVVLKNQATGAVASAQIAPDGRFTVPNLPAGAYDVSVPIPCCMYTRYEQKAVTIAAGQTVHADLHIGWGMNLGTIGDDPVQLGNDMRSKSTNVKAKTPRTADGHPDFSGVWTNLGDPNPPRTRVPMKPWAAETLQKMQATFKGDLFNAGAYCLPQFAVPTAGVFPYKFVQTKTEIVQIMEFLTPAVRQIFMDGRKHPDPNEWNPAWYGHSVGHWEGDTLVVDTVGFNEITPAFFSVHSEKMHVVERYRRPNYGTLEVQITAEDPDAWTGPYTTKVTAGLAEKEEVQEWVCAENNQLIGPNPWKGRP